MLAKKPTQKITILLITEAVLFILPWLLVLIIGQRSFILYYYIVWFILVVLINLAVLILLLVNRPTNFEHCIPFLLLMPILPFIMFYYLMYNVKMC
ncbi:hypothetical protein Q766_17865 [Flavobacterium subsaxonicum WB 4.1-42 = DSM 21790]|uniref:Uncharacterized protein n=1 Tax=Flavobacterium subsaxonicum WB 4.1-42 = DSM 21790 TaxID=1121898 RepID=A0A0A2MIX9_9FLAO|nr:hypothetical protein Q766_17865 [Flavobacterium subsaxonicum WB 4.1-42 = DSM 21790]